MQNNKIGFFGGSFNPIHFGHLNLAFELMERAGLKEVIFCPAFLSPHKKEQPAIASAEDRLEMVKRAVQEIKQFQVLDWEVKRAEVSYTADTLEKLKKKYPDSDLHLLLAQDTLASLTSWKGYKQILKLADPLIGFRNDVKPVIPAELKALVKNNLIPTRQLHISSTAVRERLKKGLYCGHLVPKQVLDYICQHQLY